MATRNIFLHPQQKTLSLSSFQSKISAIPGKEGRVVKQGREEGLRECPFHRSKNSDSPPAFWFDKSSGYMWIIQQKKIEHHSKKIYKLVSYNTEIHSYIEKTRIKKLKELMPWRPVSEITMHNQATGKIHLKSLANSLLCMVEAFAAGQ